MITRYNFLTKKKKKTVIVAKVTGCSQREEEIKEEGLIKGLLGL